MFQGALLTLSLAVFVTMLGNCMVMSFLPIYVQQFGFGEFGAGLLFSVHAATRTVILPFTGRLSDRWERKYFLLVGLLLYTVTSFAYLPAGDVTAFILIMMVHGTATAIMHPVAMAYVGDLAPKGQEGTYSGYLNTAMLGGVAGGPVLGGMIKDLFGMSINFLIMGGLSLTALVCLALFLPRVESSAPKAQTATALRSLLTCKPIVGVACFRFSYALTNALTWVFLPLLATHLLPLSTTEVGILISINVLVSTLLQTPCGRLADRVNKASLITIGGLGGALALVFFPFAQEFWQLLVLNICVGAMYGLAFPSHMALAMEHGHQYGMGTVMSLLMMAHGVGMMVGPALFGTIASQYGLGSAFWSGGIMGVILILACYVLTNGVPVSQAETEKALETEPVAAD
jgi:MFS family permease